MKREVVERVRSKAFLVSTAITILLVGGVVAAIAVAANDTGPASYRVGLVGDSTATLDTSVQLSASASGALVSVEQLGSVEAARTAISDDRIDAAIVPPDLVIVNQAGESRIESILALALEQNRFIERLQDAGVSEATIEDLLRPGNRVEIEGVVAGDDETDVVVAGIGVILLFMVITLYGQWVLTGVLEEKSNRVVELVVSAVPVRTLLWAKVIGIGALGFVQMVLLVGLGLGAATGLDVVDLPETTVATAVWAVVWFVLGFGFYAVLYAAAGSLVSRQEDAQTAVMPVVLSAVTVYMTTFIFIVPNPESTLARILSLLPPYAPIAMPPRIALDAAAPWEIATAIVFMVIGTIGVMRLAARIYTGAVLRTGARMKVFEAWRSASDVSG